MSFKALIKKAWTWRRDRAARRLRERLADRMGWHQLAKHPEEAERRIAYITAAPIRKWRLREKYLFIPGGVVTAEHSEKLTELRLRWILQGDGLRELKRELEYILELSTPLAQSFRNRHYSTEGHHGQEPHSR